MEFNCKLFVVSTVNEISILHCARCAYNRLMESKIGFLHIENFLLLSFFMCTFFFDVCNAFSP